MMSTSDVYCYITWFSASVWFSRVIMTGKGEAMKPYSLIAATQSYIRQSMSFQIAKPGRSPIPMEYLP